MAFWPCIFLSYQSSRNNSLSRDSWLKPKLFLSSTQRKSRFVVKSNSRLSFEILIASHAPEIFQQWWKLAQRKATLEYLSWNEQPTFFTDLPIALTQLFDKTKQTGN